MLGKALGQRTKPRKLSVGQAYDVLVAQESDALLDQEQVQQDAVRAVENDAASPVALVRWRVKVAAVDHEVVGDLGVMLEELAPPVLGTALDLATDFKRDPRTRPVLDRWAAKGSADVKRQANRGLQKL